MPQREGKGRVAINEPQKYQMPARMHQVGMASSTEAQVTEGRPLNFINLHYRTYMSSVSNPSILQLGQRLQQYFRKIYLQY